MIRKILFTTILALSLSVIASAQFPPCPTPNISNVKARRFNSQIFGSGVEVTWDAKVVSPCVGPKTLSVTVFLETIKGEKLTLRTTVTSGVTSAKLAIPASKVHIFTASDAKLKMTPIVAIVHDRR